MNLLNHPLQEAVSNADIESVKQVLEVYLQEIVHQTQASMASLSSNNPDLPTQYAALEGSRATLEIILKDLKEVE